PSQADANNAHCDRRHAGPVGLGMSRTRLWRAAVPTAHVDRCRARKDTQRARRRCAARCVTRPDRYPVRTVSGGLGLSAAITTSMEPRGMRYEIDIYGVVVPALLPWLLVTYALIGLLHRTLRKMGFYRLVWHPPLFDLALFICLLGGVVYLSLE